MAENPARSARTIDSWFYSIIPVVNAVANPGSGAAPARILDSEQVKNLNENLGNLLENNIITNEGDPIKPHVNTLLKNSIVKKLYGNATTLTNDAAFDVSTVDEFYNNLIFKLSKANNLSRITSTKKDKTFLINNLPTYLVSLIYPKLTFYARAKIDGQIQTRKLELTNDNFQQITDIENILKPSGRVGIKSFSWEFAGTNPASAKQISARLVLSLENIYDLFGTTNIDEVQKYFQGNSQNDPGANGDRTKNLAHLITRSGLTTQTTFGTTFLLLCDITFDIASEHEDLFKQFFEKSNSTYPYQSFKASLSTEFSKSIILSIIKHSFDFDEQGKTVLTIEYQGQIDSDTKQSNLFAGVSEIEKTDTAIDERISSNKDAISQISSLLSSECFSNSTDNNTQKTQLEEKRRQLESKVKDLEAQNSRTEKKSASDLYSVMARIIYEEKSELIKMLLVTEQNVTNWASNRAVDDESNNSTYLSGVFGNKGNNNPATGGSATQTQAVADGFTKPQKFDEEWTGSDIAPINFVYLGDFIEFIFQQYVSQITDPTIKQQYEKSIILLPQIEYRYTNDANPKTTAINIGDIPIRLSSIQQWFAEKLASQQKKSLTIKELLLDVVPDLLNYHLNDKSFEIRTPIGFTLSELVCNSNTSIPSQIPLSRNPQALTNLFYEYQDNQPYKRVIIVRNTLAKTIQSKKDQSIFTLYTGSGAGFLKSMKFTRIEQQGLAEAKATTDQQVGIFNVYREPYNCKVQLQMNGFFSLGEKIRLVPNAAISNLTAIGLGGFYDVIKITNTIDSGKYTTDVDCVFSSFEQGASFIGSGKCEREVSSAKVLLEKADELEKQNNAVSGGASTQQAQQQTSTDQEQIKQLANTYISSTNFVESSRGDLTQEQETILFNTDRQLYDDYIKSKNDKISKEEKALLQQ